VNGQVEPLIPKKDLTVSFSQHILFIMAYIEVTS